MELSIKPEIASLYAEAKMTCHKLQEALGGLEEGDCLIVSDMAMSWANDATDESIKDDAIASLFLFQYLEGRLLDMAAILGEDPAIS